MRDAATAVHTAAGSVTTTDVAATDVTTGMMTDAVKGAALTATATMTARLTVTANARSGENAARSVRTQRESRTAAHLTDRMKSAVSARSASHTGKIGKKEPMSTPMIEKPDLSAQEDLLMRKRVIVMMTASAGRSGREGTQRTERALKGSLLRRSPLTSRMTESLMKESPLTVRGVPIPAGRAAASPTAMIRSSLPAHVRTATISSGMQRILTPRREKTKTEISCIDMKMTHFVSAFHEKT